MQKLNSPFYLNVTGVHDELLDKNEKAEESIIQYWKCVVVSVDDFAEAKIVLEMNCPVHHKREMLESVSNLFPNQQENIIVLQKRYIQLN